MAESLVVGAIGAVAAIAGGLLTGAYDQWRDYLRRPELRLDFGNHPSYRTKSTFFLNGQTVTEHYVRLKVWNEGKDTARNCLVYLNAVTEVVNGQERELPFHDPRPLSWAGWRFNERDIPQGVAFFVDLVGVLEQITGWRFKGQFLTQAEEAMTQYEGTLWFSLTTTSSNAGPYPFSIDVTYNGNHHQLSAIPSPR